MDHTLFLIQSTCGPPLPAGPSGEELFLATDDKGAFRLGRPSAAAEAAAAAEGGTAIGTQLLLAITPNGKVGVQ